jgi:hypothetical protein
MCFPALIPVAIGLVGGLMQGQAGKAQADSQAAALRRNAFYLKQSGQDATARGIIDSDQARVQTQSAIGTQRAAMASNGGVVDQDSNAIIQQDTAQMGELDALTISNNAAREAYGFQVQAQENLRTAKNIQKQGDKAPLMSMLGGALGGAGGMMGGLGGGGSAAPAGGTYGGTGVAVGGQQGFRAGRGSGR